MNTSSDRMAKIHLTKEDVVGQSRWKEKYDVLNVVIKVTAKVNIDVDKRIYFVYTNIKVYPSYIHANENKNTKRYQRKTKEHEEYQEH